MTAATTWELDREHEEFRASVRAFVDRHVRPVVEESEQAGRPPAALLKEMGSAGLLGLAIGEEDGGGGGDSLAMWSCPRSWPGPAAASRSPRWSAPTWRPAPRPVRHRGAAARWLPARVIAGETVAAIAVTEPGTGSDVAGITTRATPHGRGLGARRHARCSSPTPGSPTCSSSPPAPRRDGHRGITHVRRRARHAGPVAGPAAAQDGLARLRHPRGGAGRRAGARRRPSLGEPRPGLPPDHGGLPARADRAGRHGRGARRGVPATWRRAYVRDREAFGAPLEQPADDRHRLAAMEIELEAARAGHLPGRGPARQRPSRGRPVGGQGQVPRRGRRQPHRRRRRAALRRRRVRGGDGRWPGTTGTPGSCASAAAPTRSSWRSWPRACPGDRAGRPSPRSHRAPRRSAPRSPRPAGAATPARWPDKMPVRDRLAVLLDPGSCRGGRAAGQRPRPAALPADGVRDRRRARRRPPGGRHRPRLHREGGLVGRADLREAGPHPGAGRPRPAAGGLPGRLRGRAAHRPDGLLPRPPRRLARSSTCRCALSGRVPQICCLHGPSAAGGAYMPAFSTGSAWSRATRRCTWPRPRVAEKVTGERTTLEEMGGALMHATVSGCGDEVFGSDWEAIAAARLLLSYLPDELPSGGRPPRRPRPRPAPTGPAVIPASSPNAAYDVREVIDGLVDAGSFFEIKARWAQEMVTGLARLDGRVVGHRGQPAAGAQRRDLRRLRRQGGPVHLAVRRLQHPAGLPAGRARVHGRRRGRAAGHHPPRRQDDHRDGQRRGAQVHGRPAQGLRGRLLRHVRPRLRAARLDRAAHRDDRADGGRGVGQRRCTRNKIAEIADPDERAAYVAARMAEQQADLNLLRMASELVVDAVVEPGELRAELIARLAAADGWTRAAAAPAPSHQPGLARRSRWPTISASCCATPAAAAARAVALGRPGRAAAQPPGPGTPRARTPTGRGSPSGSAGAAVGHACGPASSADFRYFAGGQINVADNCVDRWAEDPATADRAAVIWEGEPGDVRTRHLRRAGRRGRAGSPARCVALGVTQGRRGRRSTCRTGRGVHRDPRLQPDRRHLHDPVLRVRAGRRASRLEAARAKVVVVADACYRRGKRIPLLETLRAARGQGGAVRAHVVVDRTGRAVAAAGRRDAYADVLGAAPGGHARPCRSTRTSRRS